MRVFGRHSLILAVLFFVAIPLATIASQTPPLRFAKPMYCDWAGADWVAAADLNGDGHVDVVAVYFHEGNVSVLLGNGDGTFQPAVKYASGGSGLFSVAIADVNGDGKPDIVVLSYPPSAGLVGVLLGNGDGSVQPPVTYSIHDGYTSGLAVGDLNGDGYPDIAVAIRGDFDSCEGGGFCGSVDVLYNNGDGTFHSAYSYPSGGYDTFSITIADGIWIVTNLCKDPYCDWQQGTVCVGGRHCYDSGGADPFSPAATGDLNGDRHFDIVVANASDADVGVLLNNGLGAFQPVVTYNADRPFYVAIGDVNGDGNADIVVNNRVHGDNTGVLLGNGDGTFQTVVDFGWVGPILVLADVNGDGKLDVIGTEGVMLNISGFATTTHVTSSLNPSFVQQSVTFTVTVTSKHGPIPDGELVNIYDHNAPLTSVALAGETATYTTSALTARTHVIKAVYVGDATLAPSKAAVKQEILKYPTTTGLTSAPNPSHYGEAVTFTATVISSGPMPTGRVRFFDGPLAFGSGTLSGGVATLIYSRLLAGRHPITARYLGDSVNAKSTSPVHSQKVE